MVKTISHCPAELPLIEVRRHDDGSAEWEYGEYRFWHSGHMVWIARGGDQVIRSAVSVVDAVTKSMRHIGVQDYVVDYQDR